MNPQTLLSYSQKLHDVLGKNDDLLGTDVDLVKRDKAIDSPDALEKTFADLHKEGSLLNVGIVGRVKAGKSSLLNALVFNGESILPKAATPMTAALTTLSWGETFRVEVEFFSPKDQNEITEKANQYYNELEIKTADILKELRQRTGMRDRKAPVRSFPPSPASTPEEMARKRAEKEMREERPDLHAAYDQSQRMKKSGVRPKDIGKKESQITADNPRELASKLQDYVGAGGRFMPFAKAVHIYMPLEELKDIRVIDTPGMNDPVQSREERTTELLKSCDVVFIVSPAGQFLNEQDLDVMGRITTREGIRKIILVASQVDTQLYGSEKCARLEDALSRIHCSLAKRACQALTGLKEQRSEVGSVFDELIAHPEEDLLHSAGICHSLSVRHQDRQSWDANERQTWENLCQHYPDYFSTDNPELSKASLARLANIDPIQDVLRQVRAEKDAIRAEKISRLLEQKSGTLKEFRQTILSQVKKRIKLIQDSDAKHLERQYRHLEAERKNLSNVGDKIYEECAINYEVQLRSRLDGKQRELFEESRGQMARAEDSYTETCRRKKSGFLSWCARLVGGGYESYTATRIKIATAQVHAAIQALLRDTEDRLGDIVRLSRIEFDKKLSAALEPALEKILGADFDIDMLVTAVRTAVRALPESEFSLGVRIPDELKIQGTLKSDEAERYKEKATDFLYSLDGASKDSISKYMAKMRANRPQTISDAFVSDLEKKMVTLREQIENATQTIDRLHRLIREVEGITL